MYAAKQSDAFSGGGMAGGLPVRPLARLSLVAAMAATLCALAGVPGIHVYTAVANASQVSLLGVIEPGMWATGSQTAKVIRHGSPAVYQATPTRDLRGVAQPSSVTPTCAVCVLAPPLAWAPLPLERESPRLSRVLGVPRGRAPPALAGL
jgi:hypothetical protein